MKLSPVRQVILAVLALLLLGLQGRLWFGEGSLRHVATLEKQVASLSEQNAELAERNRLMAADVRDLKEGTEAVEEIARKDLGMIRDGETFFLIVEPASDSQ
ncbi:FtsB family cell division protein [Alloalcanivorax profundimaris]|uniref:Cell division protein FtsB n=1 Tax=Alloalcanivorax profundimaris TaxID=2735259 RepID=A0ABS0APH1_9GAMM|nr:septum formation initiator family protein [Alloalcanivorax profundimaris]MAO58879.1 septum formation initiator subfamily [Alcanivorax sp.]MBM1143379.1 septum formation initiator family protein [Alcanivorax sp. ZXX171]MCQ6263734.1 septum formation initiator family protein [Alcanivorax sp. MM125-6]UWN48297.1 Cell division protein FtsB [Alcanivorax sp. ALC70]MAY12160.1 septum formation initiator subfamily [Alcanivorax sp.]|tara:strand:+ start:45364 stop:45669 length:306 start_codon:yes stop_codon:yes gene_type:complete